MESRIATKSNSTKLWKERWRQGIAEIRVSSAMGFAQLWRLDTPPVALLNAGEKNTLQGEAVFGALINGLVKFFGAVWSPAQIAECAKVCFDEWYYLSFAELAHFAQRAKSGYYKEPGKPLFYGPFSPANIIDWFCAYTTENLLERETYFSNEHNDSTWEPPVAPVSDKLIKEFREAMVALEQQVTAYNKDEKEVLQKGRQASLEKHNALLQRSYDARASAELHGD